MKLKRFCAGLAALCMVCAVVPVLPMQESAVISANAYGELTYEDLLYTTGKMRQDDTEIEYVTIAGVTDKETVTKINIPAEIDGLPVKSIKDSAFKDCTALTTVTMPETITDIGSSAFEGCTSLASVTLPKSMPVTSRIKWRAFFGCTSLTSITIPDGVWYIEGEMFSGCTKLKSITMPDSVGQFGGSVFKDCISLTSITIPAGVETMYDNMFPGCINLTTIKVSENSSYLVEEDGVIFSKDKKTLYRCPPGDPRTEYTIPNGVTSIRGAAFAGCTALTSVVIPDSVGIISGATFWDCVNLGSITISKCAWHLERESFEDTLWLKEKQKENPLVVVNDTLIDGQTCTGDVAIPDGVTYISYSAFKGNENITSVVMPDSVTKTGMGVFENCSNLKSVTLSKNLTEINGNVFYNCSSLVSIVLPESVTAVYGWGSGTFLNSEKLESVTFLNPNCEIPDSARTIFSRMDENYQYYFDGTICGYEGSTAQAYAEKYGYKFKSLGTAPATTAPAETTTTIMTTTAIITKQTTTTTAKQTATTAKATTTTAKQTTTTAKATTTTAKETTTTTKTTETTETSKPLKAGDASGDGEIDILDVITINKAVMGKEPITDAQLKAIDFNGNGKPDSDEALTLLKYIVGIITDFNA